MLPSVTSYSPSPSNLLLLRLTYRRSSQATDCAIATFPEARDCKTAIGTIVGDCPLSIANILIELSCTRSHVTTMTVD